jgi:myo-inositol-1(or 4)-monophosphatase
MQAEIAAVMPVTSGIRRNGAASLDLAWVAAGRFDAFWERGLAAWDIAAGTLLVKEAQGTVSDLSGGPNMLDTGHILAANDTLHPILLRILKSPMK